MFFRWYSTVLMPTTRSAATARLLFPWSTRWATDVSRGVSAAGRIGQLARLPFADAIRLVTSEAGAPWAPEVLRLAFEALDRH